MSEHVPYNSETDYISNTITKLAIYPQLGLLRGSVDPTGSPKAYLDILWDYLFTIFERVSEDASLRTKLRDTGSVKSAIDLVLRLSKSTSIVSSDYMVRIRIQRSSTEPKAHLSPESSDDAILQYLYFLGLAREHAELLGVRRPHRSSRCCDHDPGEPRTLVGRDAPRL